MSFSPRQIQILFLLLNAKEPISSAKIAEGLRTSKRTVFREMNYLDRDLAAYGLTLERKGHSGFALHGSEDGKKRLLAHLENSDSFDPRNKEERRKKLLLSILTQDDVQKIYYYVDQLQVSESTIGSDLDAVEKWLQSYHIELIRRAGYGVSISCKESDLRHALLAFGEQNPDKTYTERELCAVVEELGNEIGSDVLKALTSRSRRQFYDYAAISVKRMQNGWYIGENELPALRGIQNPDYYRFAAEYLTVLCDECGIELLSDKIMAAQMHDLYTFLLGCKTQTADENSPDYLQLDGKVLSLHNLIREMAEVYDREAAPVIMEDDVFVNGLKEHLRTTITRLLRGLTIENPLLEEIKSQYESSFERAERAALILEREIGRVIPEEEIGLLVFHFGGAVYRHQAKFESRRTVQIGIVCVEGIGVSILMATGLRRHFGNRVEISTHAAANVDEADVDFLVSPFDLHTDKELVKADPMPTKEQFEQIESRIHHYSIREKSVPGSEKKLKIAQVASLASEMEYVIRNFSYLDLDQAVSFEEAAREISVYLGKLEGAPDPESILQAFMEREARSTQVMKPFDIVFLHAKVQGNTHARFMIAQPFSGEKFSDPYFQGTGTILAFLLPGDTTETEKTSVLSALSRKIFEDETLLTSICEGLEETVRLSISEILEAYLENYLRERISK